MDLHWTLLSAAILSMMLLANVAGQAKSTETSEEYLKNVISELQQQNRPSAMGLERTTGPGGRTDYLNNNGISDRQRKIINDSPIKLLSAQNQYVAVQTHKPASSDVNVDQDFAESTGHYYQVVKPPAVPKPARIEHPAPLGFTKAQLAYIYKNALKQGSTINLSALTNTLPAPRKPQAPVNHLRLQPLDTAYYYYFYPLKSFASELKPKYEPPNREVVSQGSGNQPANPLFMAVSGFIGMAMLFMAGVLFMPRFAAFKSRGVQDEFLQLTKIAGAAIEGRNCSERFACELGKAARTFNLPLERIRFLETLLPTNLGNQVARVRKSATSRRECRLVFCRKTLVQKDKS